MEKPQFVYSLVSWWAFELFPLIGCYEECWCEHLHTCFCADAFFLLLLSIYLGVEFLGHGNSVFNFLKYCQIVFQSHCTILYLNQQCMRVLIPLQPGQQLLICLFDYSLSHGCKVIFHCVLICFSRMLNDSIFSFADWSFVKFLWKNVCCYPPPILTLGYLFIIYL